MALIRCPLCKAENTVGPGCRRCKADLSLLFDLEERRKWTVAEAWRLLAAGELPEANWQAQVADWMRSDRESLRLFALTRLLRRDFAGAWMEYRSLRNVGAGSPRPLGATT
jgi:methylphosphotriester-DNA--protein-cysteine methyltransferase